MSWWASQIYNGNVRSWWQRPNSACVYTGRWSHDVCLYAHSRAGWPRYQLCSNWLIRQHIWDSNGLDSVYMDKLQASPVITFQRAIGAAQRARTIAQVYHQPSWMISLIEFYHRHSKWTSEGRCPEFRLGRITMGESCAAIGSLQLISMPGCGERWSTGERIVCTWNIESVECSS